MNRSGVEKISKALADETRLRIFEAISAAGRMNCGAIVAMRGVTPATVSHHLNLLRRAWAETHRDIEIVAGGEACADGDACDI